jgi:hypothetical protein
MLVKDGENERERTENDRESDMCDRGKEGDEAYGYGGNE